MGGEAGMIQDGSASSLNSFPGLPHVLGERRFPRSATAAAPLSGHAGVFIAHGLLTLSPNLRVESLASLPEDC